jgi:hypothetical protein
MAEGGEKREPRRRRRRPEPAAQPTSPRWAKEAGPKICRKCGGRMYPADWIWQKYGLCVGWRCSKCKEKVMARSLPFKGLRKRSLEPGELPEPTAPAPPPSANPSRPGAPANGRAARPPAGPSRPPAPPRRGKP